MGVQYVNALSGSLGEVTLQNIRPTIEYTPVTIYGDVIIDGTITGTGSASFVDTSFEATSSLSVTNIGTGPALSVTQEGENAVAAFYDHESTIALYVDGTSGRPANVGVKTTNADQALTVAGSISATKVIYGTHNLVTNSNYRGTYSNLNAYTRSDIISYNNSTWILSSDISTSNSPDTEASWEIFTAEGATSHEGDTGATGHEGATGATGHEGATGATGHEGATGATGHEGATGATGYEGATGTNGWEGPTGHEGATGATGHEGDTGATGYEGATGATGYEGATGHEGDTGATGHEGDTGATGHEGATGATGHEGDTGATGHEGATGATGYEGATGATGYEGATGTTGWEGPTGYEGATGATGHEGATGATGHEGATGATGYEGATGATGYEGATGSTGHEGATGSTGHEGDTGATGYEGATGSTGHEGATGSTGHEGATGSTGHEGDTGANGHEGDTGANGHIGYDGHVYYPIEYVSEHFDSEYGLYTAGGMNLSAILLTIDPNLGTTAQLSLRSSVPEELYGYPNVTRVGSVVPYVDEYNQPITQAYFDTQRYLSKMVWVTLYSNQNVAISPALEGVGPLRQRHSYNLKINYSFPSHLRTEGGEDGSLNYKYSQLIGDNSSSIFTVSHNLSTSDVAVSVMDVGSKSVIIVGVEVTDDNTITVDFANNVPTTEQYKVTILG